MSTCPDCGTDLGDVEVWTPDPTTDRIDQPAGLTRYRIVCPNPDCPSNDTDMAKATGPDGAQH